MKSIKRQYGITMLELLIAIALSSIVTAAILQVFLSSKQSSRLQEQMSRLQENGRFAMNVISRDLRNADYWGCVGDESRIFNNIKPNNARFIDIEKSIDGSEGNDGAPDTLSVAGSQLINEGVTRINGVFTAKDPIPVTGDATELAQKALVVGDCQKSNLFIATAANATSISHGPGANENKSNGCSSTEHCFSGDYNERALLLEAYSAQYRVEDNNLIRTTNGVDSTIASGITDFQVQYGLAADTNSETAVRYVNRSALGDNIKNVVSIRVHLLLETLEDNVTEEAMSTLFNWVEGQVGNTININDLESLKTSVDDRRIRRPFVVTVAIRNRIS